jgi:hypothetical protein
MHIVLINHSSVAVLLSILTAAFFASICLSLMAISAYLSFRLYISIRRDGSSGVSHWTSEIKGLVIGTRSNAEHQNDVKVIQETPEDELSDYTSDSDPTSQESEMEVRVKAEEYDDCAMKVQGKA